MKPAQVNKPSLKAAEALEFALEPTEPFEQVETPKEEKKRSKRGSQSKRVFHAPEGDKRLTINIKENLHKKLKIAAIEKDMTAGELIEALIQKHLK